MLDIIPTAVAGKIQDHLRVSCDIAEQGWEQASADEDTVTGALGERLRLPWQLVEDEDGNRWRWSVTYKKFRGRGPGADENTIGADGIFQVEVEDSETKVMESKGILFQAKRTGSGSSKDIGQQVRDMEQVVPGGTAVVLYGSEGYFGVDGPDALNSPGITTPSSDSRFHPLGDYLADRFLPCRSGKRGLFYDAVRKTLVVPDETTGVRRVRAKLKHRFNIEVQKKT